MQVSPGPDSTFIEKCFRWDGTSCVEKKAAIIKNGENFIADTYIYVCTTTVGPSWQSCIQWNLSIVDTIGTQLAILYTVEPLYSAVLW